jgi:hypothetical protein
VDEPQERKQKPQEKVTLEDALEAFNAGSVIKDPDELEPEKKHYPAATPDSPNPI